MRRFVKPVVLVVLLTSTFALAPVAVAVPAAGDQFCTKGDVQLLVNALEVFSTASESAFARCQFRLFDENDDPNDPFGNPDNPEIPHVFTDRDYILGGVVWFEGYEFFDRPDYDRNAAIDLLNTSIDRFFFGTAGTPDANLEEIDLVVTNYRDFVIEDFGHIVANHRYHIFKPGSLAPGEYRWRYENTFPGFEDFVARGVLVILDA